MNKKISQYKKVLLYVVLVLLSMIALDGSMLLSVGARPKLSVTGKRLYVGQYYRLAVKYKIKGSRYRWKINSTKAIQVSANGTVKAVRQGSGTITCTIDPPRGKTFTLRCIVRVYNRPVFSRTKYNVAKGKSGTPFIRYKIAGSRYKWKSSNSKVATVNTRGTIKGISRGTVTLYAQIRRAGFSTITIKTKIQVLVPATKVTIAVSERNLTEGDRLALRGTLTPSDSTDKMTWSSGNQKIAKVDSKGMVTALAQGSVTITAKADSGKTASVVIAVQAKVIHPQSISLVSRTLTLNQKETFQMKVNIVPQNVTYPQVLWESGNPSIVQVSEQGVVTAVGPGTADIRVKMTNGIQDTCKVTVVIPVEQVQISETDLTLNEGEIHQLSAQALPTEATSPKLTWSSTNPYVAEVGNDGKVTGILPGTAVIQATAENGMKAACRVTIKEIMIVKASMSSFLPNVYETVEALVEMSDGKSAGERVVYQWQTGVPQGETGDVIQWSVAAGSSATKQFYQVVKEDEGKYLRVVITRPDRSTTMYSHHFLVTNLYVARIGEKLFTGLDKALNILEDADTLEILQDVQLTAPIGWTTSASVTGIDHPTITVEGQFRHFQVSSEASLTLEGVVLDGGSTHTDMTQGGIHLQPDTKLTLTDTVIGNCSGENGGGVYGENSTIVINSGSIESNRAKSGGGLYVKGGQVTINGGAICENTSIIYGGGVFLENVNFEMKAGSVEKNSSENGGGIFSDVSTMYWNGGTLADNASMTVGGGISAANGSTVHLTGGSIYGNDAELAGGAVAASGETTSIHVYGQYAGETEAARLRVFHNTTGGVGAALYHNKGNLILFEDAAGISILAEKYVEGDFYRQ